MYSSTATRISGSQWVFLPQSCIYFLYIAALRLLLLRSWALRATKVFYLYNATVHSLGYPKQFQLNHENLPQMLVLLARLCWTIVQRGSCRSMRLGIVSVYQWQYICIPIPFMFWYKMTLSCDYGAAVTFHRPIYLRVIGCCGEHFNLKERQRVEENLLYKVASIVSQYVGWYAIRHASVLQEYWSFLRRIGFGCKDYSYLIRKTVCYNRDMLISIFGPQ